jgi:thioesterase domain-containing protein
VDTRIDEKAPREKVNQAAAARLRRKAASFTFAMRALPWKHKALYLYERVVELRRKLGAPRPAKIPPPEPPEDLTPALKAVEAANYQARARYRHEPYAGRITYFRSNRWWISIPLFRELSRVARGGWEVYDVPGHHRNLMEPPNVQYLAKAMRRALAKAYVRIDPDKEGDGS